MNRSKLFLGISAGVLVVVAFTARKVTRFTGLVNCYYYGVGSTHCTKLASLKFYYVGTGGATAGPSSSPAHAHLFTFSSGATCISPCFKKAGD